MLAASWSHRGQEFESELKLIRDAIRRLDDTASREEKKAAAE
jgi:hypothetical protein